MPLADIFLLEGSSEGFLSLIEKWRNALIEKKEKHTMSRWGIREQKESPSYPIPITLEWRATYLMKLGAQLRQEDHLIQQTNSLKEGKGTTKSKLRGGIPQRKEREAALRQDE